jgi:hypothetical protein
MGEITRFGCGCARLRGREGSDGLNSLFRPCVGNFTDDHLLLEVSIAAGEEAGRRGEQKSGQHVM